MLLRYTEEKMLEKLGYQTQLSALQKQYEAMIEKAINEEHDINEKVASVLNKTQETLQIKM